MKPIEIIEKLVPYPILMELSAVLERGSTKDGIITHHKSYCYYTYKLIKHLLRGMLGFKYDHDSGKSHFAHATIRLLQIWLKSLGWQSRVIVGYDKTTNTITIDEHIDIDEGDVLVLQKKKENK